MNRYLKPSFLPTGTLVAGTTGFLLRMWLMKTGEDARGLLVTTHPAHVLVFVLTALILGALFLCVRPLNATKRYLDLFPNSNLSGAGCIVAAVGILLVSFRDRSVRSDMVTTVCLALGFLAAICLVLVALCRFQRRRPVCYFHAVITLFLAAHLVSQYRLWSSEPQLQVYFFPLLSSVFLMLTAYHAAVLDAKKASRRWYVFCNQSALFFCCVSLWSENWLFYLTMAFWMFTSLCDLGVQPSEDQEEAP